MDALNLLNQQLLDAMRTEQFAGYDPFDLLNSRLLRATPLYRSEWVRLAFLQFGKRSPINFRRLLAVPRRRNPKGIALIISGMLQDFQRTGEDRYLVEARELALWLLTQRSSLQEWQHSAWGYHFDWQARAFFAPAGKPNIITTCYVAKALYELGSLAGDAELVGIALDAAGFISKHLYVEADGRKFFAYIPGEVAFVHNASLWGAAWCAFAGRKLNDQGLMSLALVVAQQSAGEQATDGSWPYGSLRHHRFVDSFHTGYNLEALNEVRNSLGTNCLDECIRKGYRFYVDRFFEGDGTVKYYSDDVYPIDMHCFAQAIFTLLRVGRRTADVDLCDRVVRRAIDLLYLPGRRQFAYQKTRWLTNRISYIRWTQAWGYYAFAFYIRTRARLNHAQN